MRVLCVAGARPNFIKIAPLMRELAKVEGLEVKLVHTGQHYDEALSRVFFDELAIPRPDINLDVGSSTHAQQTAEIMRRFEEVVEREQPAAVVVVGDVNSTIACALVASKMPLAEPFRCSLGERRRPLVIHVEAGLRSFDNEMPEEINRRLTDQISELLFVTDPAGIENLAAEGRTDGVHFVGNVMIDTLLAARDKAAQSDIRATLGVVDRPYALVTLHRPRNVDNVDKLRELLGTLDEIGKDLALVFPVHPRTRKRMDEAGITLSEERWVLSSALGYFDFIHLVSKAEIVLTDSGGIQEETTVLGVPCLTLRENTERPVTISQGSNQLVGTGRAGILAAYARVCDGDIDTSRRPDLWDGKAAERVAATLRDVLVA